MCPHDYLEGEDAPGAVSREVAEVLAEQVRIGDTDFGLSVTGVAGTGIFGTQAIGLVFVGLG